MFIRFRRNKDLPNAHDLPDQDLILRYRKTKDAELIAILFQRYTHLVYGVSVKYLEDPDDAKDAVMEIFEDLMQKLLDHEIHNFKSWLHSVTRNHCLMQMRRKRPERIETEFLAEPVEEGFMELWEEMHQRAERDHFTREHIDRALQSLKEPQRKCVELVYLQGKSYHEVCRLTGYTEKEVKSYVQNGKRNLKIRLENHAGKS